MRGQEHKCQNCGKIYPCPEEIDKCDLPFEFGNCSLKCKLDSWKGPTVHVTYGETASST